MGNGEIYFRLAINGAQRIHGASAHAHMHAVGYHNGCLDLIVSALILCAAAIQPDSVPMRKKIMMKDKIHGRET